MAALHELKKQIVLFVVLQVLLLSLLLPVALLLRICCFPQAVLESQVLYTTVGFFFVRALLQFVFRAVAGRRVATPWLDALVCLLALLVIVIFLSRHLPLSISFFVVCWVAESLFHLVYLRHHR